MNRRELFARLAGLVGAVIFAPLYADESPIVMKPIQCDDGKIIRGWVLRTENGRYPEAGLGEVLLRRLPPRYLRGHGMLYQAVFVYTGEKARQSGTRTTRLASWADERKLNAH